MSRKGQTRAQRGPGGWLAVILLLSASLFVGWQVIKASASDAWIKSRPVMVATIASRDPRLPMALAMLEFRAGGGRVRPETRRAATDAFSRLPLAYEPVFLAGISALAEGDEARGTRLLIEARRRAPRARYTRLMLLDRFLRSGQIDQAAVEMKALGGLIPRAGGLLVAELARLAQSPSTSPALESALRKNPDLRDRLLNHLADKGADTDLILQLARTVPAPRGAALDPRWRQSLIATLVRRNDVDRAYELWRSFSAPSSPPRKNGVYDPQFQGLPGLPPFNWDLPVTPQGSAERRGGALQVEYYGRQSTELASQLLMLAPGPYRLSFIAEGAAEGESSRITWTVHCSASKAQIAEMPLRNVDYSPKRLAGEFVVPPQSCSSQWLKLVGVPAEFIKPQSVSIRDLRIAVAP